MVSATTQQRLAACMTALRSQIAQHPDGRCRTPRFDQQLFTTTGTRLADYLLEIERNLELFGRCQNAQERLWLADRLLNQIAALQREASSQQLRPRREQPAASPRQQKLEEYREYERRLKAMIDQREQRLARAESLAVQQQLKQDLEVLEGRLARCRQAIAAVEWALSLRGDVR
ncbi:primosomal replication protein PriC [Pantoea sp. KPR_PJ]|uniref:primosomal replication protein PriC n=1 Tax=Pantoea sp. KPR_PJ TaxID=2738375 RepID=UPI003528C730